MTAFGIPKSPLKAVDLGCRRRDFQQMPDTQDPRGRGHRFDPQVGCNKKQECTVRGARVFVTPRAGWDGAKDRGGWHDGTRRSSPLHPFRLSAPTEVQQCWFQLFHHFGTILGLGIETVLLKCCCTFSLDSSVLLLPIRVSALCQGGRNPPHAIV